MFDFYPSKAHSSPQDINFGTVLQVNEWTSQKINLQVYEIGKAKDGIREYSFNQYVQWIIALGVMLWLPVTFVPTVGWLSVWPVISNIGSQCRFVIKRWHIFTIPFRVKGLPTGRPARIKARVLRACSAKDKVSLCCDGSSIGILGSLVTSISGN